MYCTLHVCALGRKKIWPLKMLNFEWTLEFLVALASIFIIAATTIPTGIGGGILFIPVLMSTMAITFLGSVIGMTVITWVVKKLSRLSMLVFILGTIVALGCALIIYFGVSIQ